jgi:hypothetical protein
MVESVKSFGLHHGEKVWVGLMSLLCVLLVVLAGSKQSIDVTPEQIQKAAESAQQNLSRPQAKEDIQEKLNQEGLVPPGFAKKVAELTAGKQNESKFTFTGPAFVYTEPGAGLIRDTPELIAPEELYATSNRGSIQVFVRDDQGSLVYEEAKKGEPKKAVHRSSRRRRSSGSMSMSSSGSSGSMMGGAPKPLTAEQKKEQEAEKKRKAELFVGNAKDEDAEIESKAEQGQKPKETSKGVRPVSIVGVLDHQKLKDNYASALKDSNAAPHYLRIDVQRQEYRDEKWTDWVDVNRAANDEIQNNLTEIEEELAPENVRLEGLVDRLPFFKVGYYRGVHVAEFVPKDKRETAPPPAMMASGAMGESSSSAMASSMMMSMPTMPTMEMGSSSGGMMMAGPAGPMGPEDTNFAKTTEKRIMVRTLDFTCQPDLAYRYRLRIVVKNPNLGWENVSPGTDTTSQELTGPWSEPTEPVRVPADVATFVVRKAPGSKRNDAVEFMVVKWNPDDGLTVCKTFDGAPGQIIGGPDSAAVPKEDGKGRTSKPIDFTSRQLLLDTSGSDRSLAGLGLSGSRFESPIQALVLRPDGLLVVRDQALDTRDEQLKQMQNIYNRTLKDADAGGKKTSAAGSSGSSSSTYR